MTYPVSAAGNFYTFLWSTPPYAGTTPVFVLGFSVHGLARVDPANFFSAFSGVLDASGTVTHSVAIPNQPEFLGYSWDLQSLDLEIATASLYFADNDLTLIAGPRNMVPIPPGSFPMGDALISRAAPVHTVTITHTFWIGKYEVTQAEYQALVNSNPSTFQGPAYPNSANRPVELVTWNEAMAYCAALNVLESAAGRVPLGYQYRLPTEAEWEYCCRAGTTTEYNTGTSLDCLQANCNHCVGVAGETSVVGSYLPNAWGLYDMHGNVWEWCLDSWDSTPNYPATAVTDPYVTTGQYRAWRGGSWLSTPGSCRSANRVWLLPTQNDNSIGFRVVLAPILVP
jgi:formylglycine-generating enzyme required for sulfatase activity